MGFVRMLGFALVALTLTLFTWLGGGFVSTWLTPWSLWLTLLLVEVMLVLPEQSRMESLFEARRRVWHSLVRDPLLWLTLALTLYLFLQWLNACTVLDWNVKSQQWTIDSPAFEFMRHPDTATALALPPPDRMVASWKFFPATISWLPWSLRSGEAWDVMNWFPPVLFALLLVRHAMQKQTKRRLLTFVCAMTMLLSIVGIVQYLMEAEFLYWGRPVGAFFYATFGYPNHAACFFPAVMALSTGLWMWAREHQEQTRVPAFFYLICALLCAVSGVLSGSRAGVLFVLAVGAFSTLYVVVRWYRLWSPRLRWAIPSVLMLFLFVIGGTFAFRLYAVKANQRFTEMSTVAKTEEERSIAGRLPRFTTLPMIDPVLQEIAETDWAEFLAHPMLMRAGYQGILAMRQHAAYPWYGSGAWSFRWLNAHYIDRTKPEEAAWLRNRLGVGQANVHNDTLQFLAEHGRIGFALMLGCLAALLFPFLKRLWQSPSLCNADERLECSWLNRLNVAMVFIFVATTLIALHSFIDLVFRSPACMMLYGLMFVCAPGLIVGYAQTKEKAHA
ncbi:MAG: O-antigen ligase family protein [Kiritimatiellia bacterium]